MNLTVEVINTGSELLLGSVINTHLKLIAEGLFPLGLRVERQLTVPDGPAIGVALAESFTRAQIVLVTGGLGPTTDDITREAVAELLGLELVHDETVMEAIRARFARRGLTLSSRVGLQALRPAQAQVLMNEHGTAPGLYLPPLPQKTSGALSPHLFLLPGPPRELQPMFEQSVLPILEKLLPPGPVAQKRSYRISGLGESQVEAVLGEAILALGVELGYCARPGEVDLRVIGTPPQLAAAEALILEKVGAHIVSTDESSLEKVVLDLLGAQSRTLATAESCTGGYLAHRLTNVPGASQSFLAGFVTYANEAKIRDLGVPAELIAAHGAVSAQVAQAMARGAQLRANSDFALATTGIAGPGGATEQKPLGTVFIALADRHSSHWVQFRFATDRENFKSLTSQSALDLLRQTLTGAPNSTVQSSLPCQP